MNAVDDLLRRSLLVVLTSIVASGLVIAAFHSTRWGLVVGVGSIGAVVTFLLAGNHRLYCLYGIVLFAPLALASNFRQIIHMGGAMSFTVDAIDPFIGMLIGFLLRDMAYGWRRNLRLTPLAPWLFGMIALGLVDVAFSPLRVLPAQETLRMIKCYLLLFVLVNEIQRERQFIHVLTALIIGVALQSTLAIAQWVIKGSLGLQALGEADLVVIEAAALGTFTGGGLNSAFRANGLMGHPNLLSAYLAMLLPLCIALLFSRLSMLARVAIAGATVLGLAALMMTLSRTGWLSFGVAVLLLFVLSFLHPRLQRRYLFARVSAIGSMVVVAIAFSGAILRRLLESDPGAVNFRVEWNWIAWDMVKEKPFFGFGLNTWVYHLPGRTRFGGITGLTDMFGSNWPVVHNVYLLTWSEQGTIGMLCFLGWHFALFGAALRNLRRYYNDVLFAINLGCLCGVISVMIDGLASFYLRIQGSARSFWIVAALIIAIDYWNRNNTPHRALPDAAPPDLAGASHRLE